MVANLRNEYRESNEELARNCFEESEAALILSIHACVNGKLE